MLFKATSKLFQYAVLLSRLEMATAGMTLSIFRSALRQGHLETAKPVFTYHHKIKHAVLRFKRVEPHFCVLLIMNCVSTSSIRKRNQKYLLYHKYVLKSRNLICEYFPVKE